MIRAVLSLPSFVPGLVLFLLGLGLSVFVVLLCRCLCLRDCWCLSVFVVLLSVGGWAPLCLSCLCGCCRLPSLPFVASLPPAVGPVWRPGPVWTLVPPSGYLVAFVTAWLPCFIAGSVVVLCRPSFMLSHGSKGLWLCVGFVLPSTPCCMCCSGAQYYHAEVFICDDPGSPLDTAKLHYCHSWL